MSAAEKHSNATFTEPVFMYEELPGIYRSRYDIENFFFTNRVDLYSVVEPGQRALLCDVGHAKLNGVHHLDATNEMFNVPWENMDVFVTHFHADHDGNVPYMIGKGLKNVYVGDYIPFSDEVLNDLLLRAGFVEKNDFGVVEETSYLMGLIDEEDRYFDKATILPEGHILDMAGYNFEVMYTPGHSPSHACLIEREHGILFAGDHVLDSAPGLMQMHMDENILQKFLGNLDYLRTCNLEHIFMCHTDSLHGHETINTFLTKLINKYDKPLGKMFDLASSVEGLSAYQIAERYYDRIPGGLASEPDNRRGRRVTISLSYLEYLCSLGLLGKEDDHEGVRRYFPIEGAKLVLPSESFPLNS